MDADRPGVGSRPQSRADDLIADREERSAPALERWHRPVGDEGPIGNTDGGNVENGADVQRETGAPRVITAGGVRHDHVEVHVECLQRAPDRPLELFERVSILGPRVRKHASTVRVNPFG